MGEIEEEGSDLVGVGNRGRILARNGSGAHGSASPARIHGVHPPRRPLLRKDCHPALESVLGEALSKTPARRTEALARLQALAAKDLITSPQGYAALARLHHAAGRDDERDSAVARCKKLGRRRTRVQCSPVVELAARTVAP